MQQRDSLTVISNPSFIRKAIERIYESSERFHWVGFYELSGDRLLLKDFIGKPTDHTEIPLGMGICGQAVTKNQDLNIPDVSVESNYLACSLNTKSELVVLVRNRSNEIVGQLDIDSDEMNAFSVEDEAWVKSVAKGLGEVWPE